MKRSVRIGGGSAGYGDGTMATPRLIRDGALDYVMLDYLSEYFMPQAGRARRQDSQAGYVMYFPDELFSAIESLMATLLPSWRCSRGSNPLRPADENL